MLSLLSLLPGQAPESPPRPPQEYLELGEVKDGNFTVLSRYGKGYPKSANLISLGELIHWRSPRGLNYRTGERAITIAPYDRSGSATFRRADGRVETASGSLAGLRGKRLVRRVRGLGPSFFLTARKEDYLVDVRHLKGYLGDRFRRRQWRDQLYGTYWPATLVPEGWKGLDKPYEAVDRTERFDYGGRVSATVNGLHIEVSRWELKVESVGSTAINRSSALVGTFTNETPSPMAIQPERLGFYDGVSLPCSYHGILPVAASNDQEEFSLRSLKPSGTISYLRSQSLLLAPNQVVGFSYETFRTPWAQMGNGYTQCLRYADGLVDITFRAFPNPEKQEAE